MEPEIRRPGIAVTALFAVTALAAGLHLAPVPVFAQMGFGVVTLSAGGVSTPTPSKASAANSLAAGTTRPAATSPSGTQSPSISAATPIPTATSTNSGGGTDNIGWYIVGTMVVAIVVGFVARQYLARQRP
jgi:hypothetical protein